MFPDVSGRFDGWVSPLLKNLLPASIRVIFDLCLCKGFHFVLKVRKSWIDVAAVGNGTVLRLAQRRNRRLRRRLVTGLVTVASLSVATVAYGYWVATGSGDGLAMAMTPSNITISAGSPVNALYPGTSSDVALTLDNNRDISLRVNTFALDTSQGVGGFAVDSLHAACAPDSAQLSFTPQSTGWDLAGLSALQINLPAAITMGSGSPAACQGASFTVYLKAS